MTTEPTIRSSNLELTVGDRTTWCPGVVLGPNCRQIEIGHGCFFSRDLYIDVEELSIGDYVTIHHGSILHGKSCRIGHNCWIGHYTILDALGGELAIGNNVGVGAHSQLWSHMKFGDLLEGCRWNVYSRLVVEDDVWFVGHCIVTPIRAHEKSMLHVGGVAVQDMLPNRAYAGSPAQDVTGKLGPQFDEGVSLADKEARFDTYIREYEALGNAVEFIRACRVFPREREPDHTYFNIAERSYLPRYSGDEHDFMKFLLYEKAKFVPAEHEP
jgi:acetyltransferase-like isoleucine patch superfamily enzyme